MIVKWTPIEEKLPEENGDYLVTLPCGSKPYCYILGFHSGKFYDSLGDLRNNERVIAWMPLPEPYKEEEVKE